MILAVLTPEDLKEAAGTISGDEILQVTAMYHEAIKESLPLFTGMLSDKPTFMAGVVVGLCLADRGASRKLFTPAALKALIEVE